MHLYGTPDMILNPSRHAAAAGGDFDYSSVGGTMDLWLDASDTDTLIDIASGAATGGSASSDDDRIGRIEDKSGNDNHAKAAYNQRAYRRDGEQNGKTGLEFDGSSNVYNFDSVIPQTEHNAIFMVLDTTSIGTSWRMALNRTGSGAAALYIGTSGSDYKASIYFPYAARATQSTAIQRPVIYSFEFDVSDSVDDVMSIGIDDASPVTDSGSFGTVANLGSWTQLLTGGGQGAAVMFYKLLIYQSITSDDRDTVIDELNKEYAIY